VAIAAGLGAGTLGKMPFSDQHAVFTPWKIGQQLLGHRLASVAALETFAKPVEQPSCGSFIAARLTAPGAEVRRN
jgi:hypothetical protein